MLADTTSRFVELQQQQDIEHTYEYYSYGTLYMSTFNPPFILHSRALFILLSLAAAG